MYHVEPIYALYIVSLLVLVFYGLHEAYKAVKCSNNRNIKLHRLKHVELTLLLIMVESMAGILFINVDYMINLCNNLVFNILIVLILILNILFVQHLYAELETQ